LAVVFMPSTLVASIFKYMPELDWRFAYSMAITLMILAAVTPYLFFRRKRCL
jgi:magnesium transporter